MQLQKEKGQTPNNVLQNTRLKTQHDPYYNVDIMLSVVIYQFRQNVSGVQLSYYRSGHV